jgi:hypothetical protein
MEQKILDELLSYLKDTNHNTFQFIKSDVKNKSAFLKDIDDKILYSALLKLVKDDYVYEDFQKIGSLSGNIYSISFEGIFFINNGGYGQALLEVQRKENAYDVLQIEQKKQSISLLWLNRWVAFGAVVVAIDSILNILHFFGVYFDTSNFLLCVKPT